LHLTNIKEKEMKKFFKFFDKTLATLRDNAERSTDESELENTPYIRLWAESLDVFPRREEYVAQLHNKRDIQLTSIKVGGKNLSYTLEEIFAGKSPPDKIKLWYLGWRPSGGYYGETEAEYGGQPSPSGYTAAQVTISCNQSDQWEVVD
jgi:hypothetical protein